jgi:hypothetical protein
MQKDTNNPIAQDTTKNGSIRFLAYEDPWNYGLFPQTWEDPDKEDPDIKASVIHLPWAQKNTWKKFAVLTQPQSGYIFGAYLRNCSMVVQVYCREEYQPEHW